MLVCVLYFTAYVYYVLTVLKNICACSIGQRYGIDDVALNKKIKFVCLLFVKECKI